MVSTTLQDRIAILQSLGAKSLTLPYKSIPGVISARALEEHLKLYQGYVDTLKRVDAQLETMSKADVPKKTAWDSPFRAIKQAETYALGGVILHELFFANLTPKASDCKGLEIEKFIKQDFGSLNEWKNCMRGSILEARGWIVFAVDGLGHYRILLLDSHDCGAMFGHTPLVVLDAYEHNYWMDWGADKAGCVDGMLSHLNWEEINRRFLAR
jgi:superoxide dismutase, Fe-Mn family